MIKTTGGAETKVPEALLASGGTAAVSGDEIEVPSPAKVGGGALWGGRGVNADLQEARQRFVNMLDHEDVAELTKQADRANGMIRG